MAKNPGSITATDVNLEGANSEITATGDMSIVAPAILINNLQYPKNDGEEGQILTTDGEGLLGWTAGFATGAVNITDLLDVAVLNPLQNDVLQFNNTSGKWENTAFDIGTFELNDLTDTIITSASDGDILRYDGATWINNRLNISELLDVDTTTSPPVEDNVLVFKSDTWVPGVATLLGDNVSTLTNDVGYISDITNESINDLSDVDTTSPALEENMSLSYDGSSTFKPAFRMNWAGDWQPRTYQKHDVVTDGKWTMIANTVTSDRAAPVPNGLPVSSLPIEPVWVTDSLSTHIYSGSSYEFKENGWLKSVLVWVPEVGPDIHHYVLLKDDTNPLIPISMVLPTPNLTAAAWNPIAVTANTITPGRKVTILLSTINESAKTPTSADWISDGALGEDGIPATGRWGRYTHEFIKVDKTDADSGDQTALLASVTVNSIITTTNITDPTRFWKYIVTDTPIDQGTYYEYPVVRIANGENPPVEENTTITFEIPITQPVQYTYEDDYWVSNKPTWADITGVLELNGVEQSGKENTLFGVDLVFQPASVSDEWDFITTSDRPEEYYERFFELEPPTASNTASRPTNPKVGQTIFDISLGIPVWWNGANWVNAMGDEV